MSAKDILTELEEIRIRVWRLRCRNRKATWLSNILKAIESLTEGAIKAVQFVSQG